MNVLDRLRESLLLVVQPHRYRYFWHEFHTLVALIAAIASITLAYLSYSSRYMSVSSGIIYGGAERLYVLVKIGDQDFLRGDFQNAWQWYSQAKDAFQELQEAYPERRRSYREAERVVQSRIYLAEIGESLTALVENE